MIHVVCPSMDRPHNQSWPEVRPAQLQMRLSINESHFVFTLMIVYLEV
jgi:hypothetical protein